ncbi:hypothetical protein [Priestia megaterium]|uniref:hypothetical protein n=1 Tax=Priestia megaterium TaxID=1404 RepID=UPI0025A4A9B9|nr:hypothetical protein [Priestia megaterium]MDM8151631.1 hypothetical protein [Priestia megaterium]
MTWTTWLPWVIPGVTSAVLTAILGIIFNTKLEKHKHILQKKVQDFSLYNVKRHESYAELYKLIKNAEGRLMSLSGVRTSNSFSDFNSEDVQKYLEEFNTPKKKILEIVKLWDENKETLAIKEIGEYEKIRDVRKAKETYGAARNYWLEHELYFEAEMNNRIEDYFTSLNKLLFYIDFPSDKLEEIKKRDMIKEDTQNKLSNLKDQMTKELSSYSIDK